MTSEKEGRIWADERAEVPMTPPYVPVTPAQLPDWLADDALLVLDLRPAAAHNTARIPRALSLSVPTTLLKRPLFSLDRLAAMLSNSNTRARFANWSSASRILVYDADSSSLPDSSIISALLRKFRIEGFTRDLAWIQGGFQAVLRDATSVIDTRSHNAYPYDEDENDSSNRPAHVLRPNRLPPAAFSLSSTTLSHDIASVPINKPPGIHRTHPVSFPHIRPTFNPFFDVVRQNIELSHGITDRIPLSLPRRVRHRIQDLPFRWLRDIARRAGHRTQRTGSSVDKSESDNDDDLDPAIVAEGAEILAMQFYKIELAEQRRLMSIMEHHARESGEHGVSSTASFPFSITAGIEKGEKNRYRHIWPFEHARVRLHHTRNPSDDYVNASYVQPLGTRRRYIATQGPLPATFSDFWTLCWEQNVHVIVMLTREIEGSMVKCGTYWAGTAFGPLRLRLMSTSGQSPPENANNSSGYFPPQLSRPNSFDPGSLNDGTKPGRQPTTIKRIFELTHGDYPHMKPRKVVHLQFLEWPDMNVPDDPRGVLELIREVDKAVEETKVVDEASMEVDGGNELLAGDLSRTELDEATGIAKHAMGKNGPVLLHCSAGVGRTGGFIAVDAVLDAIRRELKKSTNEYPVISSLNQMLWPKVGGGARDSCMSEGDEKISIPHPRGGLSPSPSSALQTQSDSSSSDDSFEFDQNCRAYGKYQSSLATSASGTSSPSVKSVPHDINNIADSEQLSGTLPAPSGGPDASSVAASISSASAVNNLGEAVGNGPPPKKTSFLHSYANGLSDEGEPPSRSISPSPDDESEASPPRGRSNRDGHGIIPSIPNSPPTTPPSQECIQFKGPRRLHEDKSPAELDSFEEPIWEVVQDMREQRMSLCQSLRQYVFVHAAIIQGALMIVDEERHRGRMDIQTASPRSKQTAPAPLCRGNKTNSDSSRRLNRCRPAALSVKSSDLGSAILTGKRVASPTELPKENKWGDILLSKRPSLQRSRLP